MSRENVELVRLVYEAVARHDAETVLSFYDPDVEWDFSRSPAGAAMGQHVYGGHEGLRQWGREWREAWESYEDDCAELIDGGEYVISVVTSRGRGRVSGVEVDLTHYGVWTIREGKILRVVWFRTREEALEAAGLTE
jgi:ketosteroid isomerase-like protein